MKNELQRHKRKDAIKWTAFTLVVIILVAAVLALGAKVFNVECKISHKYDENGVCVRCGAEKPVDADKPTDEDVNGGMEMDDKQVVEDGIVLLSTSIPRALFSEYDISPIAESAQQLTATIKPAEATDKTVDWSVAWKNAASTWASGKNVTDYVTVTPTSDGALTANVSCLKAFGEQVIVTCTSRNNPTATATATVDYRKRPVSAMISLGGVTYTNTSGIALTWLGSQSRTSLSGVGVNITDSIGTLDYERKGQPTWYVQFEQSYVNAMCACSSIGTTSSATFYAKKSASSFYTGDPNYSGTDSGFYFSPWSFFAAFSHKMFGNANNVPYYGWHNSAATIMKNYGTGKIATLSVVVPTTVGDCTFDFAVKYDMASVAAIVDSVNLSGGLVF